MAPGHRTPGTYRGLGSPQRHDPSPVCAGACRLPCSCQSQTLHVCHICLHWGGFGGQCRHIWHTWSVWESVTTSLSAVRCIGDVTSQLSPHECRPHRIHQVSSVLRHYRVIAGYCWRLHQSQPVMLSLSSANIWVVPNQLCLKRGSTNECIHLMNLFWMPEIKQVIGEPPCLKTIRHEMAEGKPTQCLQPQQNPSFNPIANPSVFSLLWPARRFMNPLTIFDIP